ncbi:MAG: hypothetical protein OXK76_09285, partial [Gammaproteobacteria bacterium]|nr:hypothetical protein [Gammaproteobacteria bacterium]
SRRVPRLGHNSHKSAVHPLEPVPSAWSYYLGVMGFSSMYEVLDMQCDKNRFDCRANVEEGMLLLQAMPADALARCVVRSLGNWFQMANRGGSYLSLHPVSAYNNLRWFRAYGYTHITGQARNHVGEECTRYYSTTDIDWNPGEALPSPKTPDDHPAVLGEIDEGFDVKRGGD